MKETEEQTLKKVDNTINELCDLSCERFRKINTNEAIALAEAIGKLLAARAALVQNQPEKIIDQILQQLNEELKQSIQKCGY